MLRPTAVFRCYRTRRQIGAFLDGALTGAESALTAGHVAACARCRSEVDSLSKLSGMLRRSLSSKPTAPEWTGFWEGVRRGIEDVRPAALSRARSRWRRPRFVVATASTFAIAAALTLWGAPHTPFTPRPAAAISVTSADTEHPEGTVMVYSPPEKDLVVVWVFGLD